MHRPTSHLAHLYTVPFLWLREEHRWQGSWMDDFAGHCLLWWLSSRKTYFDSKSVSATRISLMASSSSFDFFLGHCNRHLQWSALFILLCMTGHSCSNLMPLRYERLLQWQQNRYKATMLLYKIPGVPQDVFSRLTAVCCMLLPHNPYGLPQHYKKHICGPSCSCKHQFFWISLIFEHLFCLNYMGIVCQWQPFWSTTRVCFTGQCWYFNPQWTAGQAIIKGELCLKQHYSLKELCSCYVLT